MKTSYYEYATHIPHSRLATMQHLAKSEKCDELASADPPPKTTSDVYAVTAGVKGGSVPPLKKIGNFDVRKCPLLASEDEFSSYLIQSCIQNSSILHASNCIFGPLPLVFGTSNHEIRDPRPKIYLDKFSNLISQSIFIKRSLMHQFYPIVRYEQ